MTSALTLSDLDAMYMQCWMGPRDEPQRGLFSPDALRSMVGPLEADTRDKWLSVADNCPAGSAIEIVAAGAWQYVGSD